MSNINSLLDSRFRGNDNVECVILFKNDYNLPQFYSDTDAVLILGVFVPAAFSDDAEAVDVFCSERGVGEHEFSVIESFIVQVAVPEAISFKSAQLEKYTGAYHCSIQIGAVGFHAGGGKKF